MGNSVLVFVSHSSEDKSEYIEPIVQDLEDCFLNVWIDKRKILPGDNLRKSIFRDGLDKADVVLIFFTQKSLESSWVDREIKHVLREESGKGNNFDLRKIISIFDSEETYKSIAQRYPELTDDLLHLMPQEYSSIELGQLISAVWSKYLDLQGGDVEIQRQLLSKDKEIFQMNKTIHELQDRNENIGANKKMSAKEIEYHRYVMSGQIDGFMQARDLLLEKKYVDSAKIEGVLNAVALGLINIDSDSEVIITAKGRAFFEWLLLYETVPK